MKKQKDITRNAHKEYGLSDLQPFDAMEKHIVHRDMMAHIFRWQFVLKYAVKEMKNNPVLVDFGCGTGNLLELLYRNRARMDSYVGLDINPNSVVKARDKFANVDWATFIVEDLIKPDTDLYSLRGDLVVSFEVAEHVGYDNVPAFLKNFLMCGRPGATYMLSTPNYDEQVGAAQNHIYNGRVNEIKHFELETMLEAAGFEVVDKIGTFASQRDYKELLSPAQREMFEAQEKYYEASVLACFWAPLFPEQSRNCLWVLKQTDDLPF